MLPPVPTTATLTTTSRSDWHEIGHSKGCELLLCTGARLTFEREKVAIIFLSLTFFSSSCSMQIIVSRYYFCEKNHQLASGSMLPVKEGARLAHCQLTPVTVNIWPRPIMAAVHLLQAPAIRRLAWTPPLSSPSLVESTLLPCAPNDVEQSIRMASSWCLPPPLCAEYRHCLP